MALQDRSPKRTSRQSVAAALAVGDLVYLRRAIKADRAEWCALREESQSFLKPWEPKPPLAAQNSPSNRFRSLLETQDHPTSQRHLICRRSDDTIVGMVNLSQIFRGPFQNAVIGYWCGEHFTGQGYTTDGVRACLARAFGELGLHRVECNVKPDNTPSLALARAVGFREEGFSRNYLQIAGVWADHVRFAITREDEVARDIMARSQPST